MNNLSQMLEFVLDIWEIGGKFGGDCMRYFMQSKKLYNGYVKKTSL